MCACNLKWERARGWAIKGVRTSNGGKRVVNASIFMSSFKMPSFGRVSTAASGAAVSTSSSSSSSSSSAPIGYGSSSWSC